MSNPLAIATVTACLQRSLQQAINTAPVGTVPGATVKPGKPTSAPGTSPPIVNLFLYQVTPNAHLRNADLPTRSADGALRARPRAALDLYYLLSFSGDDAQLEPQRMLGVVASHLHANPALSRQSIRDTTSDPMYQPILGASNLADAIETVRFTPLVMSLEELSKLWSVFFQTTYALSVAYQASLVLIETDDAIALPLPVLERGIYAVPMTVPLLVAIAPPAVVRGESLSLSGSGFVAGKTKVRFGDDPPVVPAIVEDARVEVPVPASLELGVHRISVVVERVVTTPAGTLRTFEVESSPLAFLLAPAITTSPVPSVAAGSSLTLSFDPPVPRDDSVRLLLGDVHEVPPPARPAPPPSADGSLTFTIPPGTPAGTYPLRVEVGGISSLIRRVPAAPGFAPALQVT